ncbi:transcription factor cp2 [Lasius niger]|uniref:Transcription factor cp2 n=1 Tax=Lasius niger TaxID=67767 RepID=A0A0J7KS62_LASNI|nr:transcription factor cp2 [Lasius niger]
MKSDLLWDKFVEENREEFPHLAPSSAQKPVKKYESEFLRKFPDIPPKFEDVPIPPGMICIHGYSDRNSQKWRTYVESNEKDDVRQTKADKKGKRKRKERTLPVWDKTDVYHPFNETVDVEFETGGIDGKRISFSEFRQNQKRKRMMNTVSGKLSSASSHSQTQ